MKAAERLAWANERRLPVKAEVFIDGSWRYLFFTDAASMPKEPSS